MTIKDQELMTLIATINRDLYRAQKDWYDKALNRHQFETQYGPQPAYSPDTPPSGYAKTYIENLTLLLKRANDELDNPDLPRS